MGEVFPKNLLIQLTKQVVEILKKDFNKEAESERPKLKSLRSKDNLRLDDKDDWIKQRRLSTRFDIKERACHDMSRGRLLKADGDLEKADGSCNFLFLEHLLIRFP